MGFDGQYGDQKKFNVSAIAADKDACDIEPIVQRVVLVRHGEGEHNATRNYKLIDPHLTEKGIIQARSLSGHPLFNGVELIVVSPLTRAVQTALEAFGPRPPHGRYYLSALHSEAVYSKAD